MPSPCGKFPRVDSLDQLVERDRDHDCSGFGPHQICVRVEAVAQLPSRFGRYHIVAFWNNRDGKEHIAMVHGEVMGSEDVPSRLHSECLTGDVMGSLRCDCRDQLEVAMQKIAGMESGLVLYMRQEGRGIGLVNKVRAYALQDQGLDTVDANLALGFRDDERDYEVAAHMLASLNVESIRLMTNNPKKIQVLQKLGIQVNGRIPHVIPANEWNRFYLETKAHRSGHQIDLEAPVTISEQNDPVIIEGA
ncbi:MAG: GTP cyclohydrolase II [Candidatus Eisenbacteria bacterium]|uniref:GTP cyclohydrolase-2 n=1 Tax=Eiseniibacteriota bacterium TaxID=2212470 RepID=A0A538U7C7_UNCEI|nr:MAG: GTP cyclohydrolase II [Candidatus Eisenbacteria bacterium]